MAFSEHQSTLKVQAEQVEETRSVITPKGPVTAEPGQWEVRYEDGNVRVIDDEQFQSSFGGGGDGEGLEKPEEPEPPLGEGEEETDEETETTREGSGPIPKAPAAATRQAPTPTRMRKQ